MMKGGTGGSSSTTAANITNNNNGEENDETTAIESWGTWDELLLACAVKRHGVKDWERVAMEVQGKTSLPNLLTTAHNCQLKYHDIRRRFTYTDNDDAAHPPPPENHDPNISWLDDLRNLRVAQLRQELHRYDVSITSLQLKVKRLEEQGRVDNLKPDLEEDDSKGHTSQNNKIIHGQPDRSKPADPENQSVNGSNSTCSKDPDHHGNKPGPGPEDRASPEPDRAPPGSGGPSGGPAGGHSESDSDKGSTQTAARDGKDGAAAAAAAAESSELGGGDSAGEMRESSEAQSSASLTRKWNTKRRRKLEVPEQQQRNNDEVLLVKSQPLVGVLQLIRANEHSSFFERRLPTQESDKYKSMVQQHLDLGSIQAKLNIDSYSSCALSFYRDLLLLFNNAVVFFPKSSPESLSAHQLRRLVLNEMKKKNLITRPNHDSPEPSDSLPVPATTTTISPPTQQPKRSEQERSDSLLAKHKSTAPIIVCRKRSSIASKPSAATTSFGQTVQKGEQQQQQQKEQDEGKNNMTSSNDHVAEDHGGSRGVVKSAVAAKAKDNPVPTGTRSSRRTSIHQENNPTKNASASTKKRSASPAISKAGTGSKVDKKAKTEAAALDKKRSAAADFLKRIKRNSPADTSKNGAGTSTRSGGEQKRRGGGKGGKVKERVLRQSGDKKKLVKDDNSSPSKRNVGRPSKKAAAEAANAVAPPKRARESGGKQEASRRPRKRTRR